VVILVSSPYRYSNNNEFQNLVNTSQASFKSL